MNETGRPQDFPLSNPRADRVRDVAKLAGRPARLKRGQFLAEGPQAVREALKLHQQRLAKGDPGVVTEVYASEGCLDRFPEFEDLAAGTNARLATDEVLAAMADTVNPQGIVAVCRFVDVALADVLDAGPRLIAVLCQVRDPGNAGTVLRAADSAGADAVVFTTSSVDIYNPKAVRSTAGSLFHLPVVLAADPAELAAACNARGIGILAADGYGQLDLDVLQDENARRRLTGGGPESAYDLGAPTAWFFGNEAQGLSEAELRLADHRVAVPVYGAAESLNLGTAATVCLYASARSQRRAVAAAGTPLRGHTGAAEA
ncbi:MAG: RNA methyltransferase [Pseudarthrobacter sp.]|nr:RNA methyltransferase [Pseudarthrobacter sp.]